MPVGQIKPLGLDALMIAIFALLARIAHRSDSMPLNFVGWLSTLWPFLLGVLIAWAVLFFWRLDGYLLRPSGLIVWFCTVVVGLTIWGLRHSAFPHWSFILVASVTSGVFLLGWRFITGWRAAHRPAD